MAAACAPCIFGAASTSLLTFPTSVIPAEVQITTLLNIGNDSLATPTVITTTILPSTTPAGAVSTIFYTDPAPLTWATLGVTLTYPTQYDFYAAFAGAAATGSGCATTITPTALTIPGNVPTASLIYPVTAGTAPLFSYLDTVPGFIGQLNNDQLEQCAPLAAFATPTPNTSNTVVTVVSSIPTTTAEITTTLPPPTTYTSTGFGLTTNTVTTPATAVTSSVIVSVNTPTGKTVVVSSAGVTTSFNPQFASITTGTSTGSNGKITTTTGLSLSSTHLSSILSAMSSSSFAARQSSSGVYTNVTSIATSTHGTLMAPSSATKTSKPSGLPYTGAAVPQSKPITSSVWWNIAALFGLVMYL